MALLLTGCGTPPEEVQHARVAEVRAREWLAQIDAGDYGGGWETAAGMFQLRMSKQEWEAAAARARRSLGEPIGRQLVAAKYTAAMPWEPPGEHVLVQYRVTYGGRASVETLLMRRVDEQWKTAAYSIRPEQRRVRILPVAWR